MAKKKVTTVTTEEEIAPEVSPQEQHDLKVAEALGVNDTPLEINATKLDEGEEKKGEEPKVEEKVEPQIDKEAIKEEVTKEVKEQIVSQLQGTQEEKKDVYKEFEKNVWDKEGRLPTYQEALDFVKTQAKEEIKTELNAEIEEENKQKEEEIKTQEAEQQRTNDELNKDWDEQLDSLVKSGKIPPIVKTDDDRVQVITDSSGKEIERVPLEPGKRARYELFKEMYLVSQERINTGAKPLTNLKEIYYEHYLNRQPDGANAPIAGARKSVSSDGGTSFKYSEIHNKSTEELLREAQ